MYNIFVKLEETSAILPYTYPQQFHGYICKLLGNEKYGKPLNDYTYTCLCGGKRTKNGIKFKDAPYFYVRTGSETVVKNFLENIGNNLKPFNFDGFTVESFASLSLSLKGTKFKFDRFSPVLVSKTLNKKNYLSKEDIIQTEQYLLDGIRKKASDCGFNIDENLSLKIIHQGVHSDIFYKKNGKDIINKGRNFVLSINCDDATKEFILIHGLGRSTGCGFGFLIPNEYGE